MQLLWAIFRVDSLLMARGTGNQDSARLLYDGI